MAIITIDPTDPSHDHYFAAIVDLHISVTTHDPRTVATVAPPYTPEVRADMANHYRDAANVTARWAARNATVDRGAHLNTVLVDERDGAVAGMVVLARANSESGPFRAEVQKFFVAPAWQGRGVGRGLLIALETIALREGRTFLTLGTATESDAANIYPKYGYTQSGYLPGYVINPATKALMGATQFYKDLTKTPPLKPRE